MLDRETSEKLQATVMDRLAKSLSIDSTRDEFTKAMLRLAVSASVITLEEYEKLNS